MNRYEQAIVHNAQWFVDQEDENGFIAVPADEYYGITGDASLIGHAMSVRTWGWVLTGDTRFRDSALRSAHWLAERAGPTRRLASAGRLRSGRRSVRLRGLLHP